MDNEKFESLYEYSGVTGDVKPLTGSVRSDVIELFKEVFGSEFNTDAETLNGRLIEAYTKFFVSVIGVNAQNAGRINPDIAVGAYLDYIGALFGVARDIGDTDAELRRKIRECCSRGVGFDLSIRNAIEKVEGTSNIVVIENGNEDPAVLPVDDSGNAFDHSITVSGHTVFISVLGGDNAAIATELRKTKSAGCSFERNPEYAMGDSSKMRTGTAVDSDTGTTFTARFYEPTRLYAKISVELNNAAYTGGDIVTDAKAAVVDFFTSRTTNSTVSDSDVIAAIASTGQNIIPTNVDFQSADTSAGVESSEKKKKLVIRPYRYVSISASDVSVTVK